MCSGPQYPCCQLSATLDVRENEGRASLCFFVVPKFLRKIQNCAESKNYKGLAIPAQGSRSSLISLIKICYEKCSPSLEYTSVELAAFTVLPRNVSIPGVC